MAVLATTEQEVQEEQVEEARGVAQALHPLRDQRTREAARVVAIILIHQAPQAARVSLSTAF